MWRGQWSGRRALHRRGRDGANVRRHPRACVVVAAARRGRRQRARGACVCASLERQPQVERQPQGKCLLAGTCHVRMRARTRVDAHVWASARACMGRTLQPRVCAGARQTVAPLARSAFFTAAHMRMLACAACTPAPAARMPADSWARMDHT